MKTPHKDLISLENFTACEISELWVELKEVSRVDEEAKAFLNIFEPWAKERLGLLS